MIIRSLIKAMKRVGTTLSNLNPLSYIFSENVKRPPSWVRRTAFVDLNAAPNGAPVSIYGTDVNGPLKIGGVTMATQGVQNQVVYTIAETGRTLYKTTAWVSGVAQGLTTIQAGNSPVIPFRVNGGRVVECSTFAQFKTAFENVIPGDVLLARGFTSELSTDGRINGGDHTLWVRSSEATGTEEMPIAILGYPGEEPTFTVNGSAQGERGFAIDADYWTIANIRTSMWSQAFYIKSKTRVVGCDIEAMTSLTPPAPGAGTGSVNCGGQTTGGEILGNIIHGGITGSRFDHAIYVTDCTNITGWSVEWNYVHSNNFGRGPQLVVNSQYPRCGDSSANKSLASHVLLDNTIDTSGARGRAIGVSHLGWYPEGNQSESPPGWPIVEGNDLIDCGYWNASDSADIRNGFAIYCSSGGAIIRLNRLYRAHGGISLGQITLKNNGDDPVWRGALIELNEIDVALGEHLQYILSAESIAKVVAQNNTTTGTPTITS